MSDTKKDTPQKSEKAADSNWVRILAWAFVLALLAVVALQLRNSQKGVLSMGDDVPPFTLTTFEGEDLSSEDFVGKVVLINFWASWCKPCEQEAEELQIAWEMYAARGDVLFLGVDYIDTEKEALDYLQRFRITYPNGPDLGTRIAQSFRILGVPETFFVDRHGKVAFVQIGPFMSLEDIISVIDRLLES